jgi:hypothetical protein
MTRFAMGLGLALIAAGLAGLLTQGPRGRISRDGPMLPLAALAWAQANCNSTLAARAGTPRIQSEDLFRVAAAYDAERAEHGLQPACRQAARVASRITEPAHGERTSLLFSSLFASLR